VRKNLGNKGFTRIARIAAAGLLQPTELGIQDWHMRNSLSFIAGAGEVLWGFRSFID